MSDKYGQAIEVLTNVVSDDSQSQSEKDAAIEIAKNLNYLYTHDSGECCYLCGYEHPGLPGYACNGGAGWD